MAKIKQSGSTQEAITMASVKAAEENIKRRDEKESAKKPGIVDGEFKENGRTKYYIKVVNREQVEKDGKMVYADDLTECSYYENLMPDEAKRRREAGEIF